MKLAKFVSFALVGIFSGILLFPPGALAASCKLSKSIGQLTLVERNVASLGKSLAGPDKEKILSGLRSKISALRSRGEGFAPKAAPLESECRALTKLFKKFKEAQVKRDAALKKLRAKRKAVHAKLKRAIAAQKEKKLQHLAKGCGMNIKLSKEKYAYCSPLTQQYNAKLPAYRAKLSNFRQRSQALLARIKAAKAAFSKIQKSASARHRAFQQKVKGYKAARKNWTNDLRKVWGQTAALSRKASKARRAAAAAAKKGRGGELGKLSGPLAPGKSGRSPGSKKHPSTLKAKQGGAMGQGKAARSTGRAGAGAGSGSEAASRAGRVFDRGDVKYPAGKPGGGVVDARGIKPRPVPERVRQKPRWRALDQKEKTYRKEQAKAQKQIDKIKKDLQAGSGNKGQLQVDLVRAREKHDKIKSKINVVKVEKEVFNLSLEEQPAPKASPPKKPSPKASGRN